jgi:hypothetical protein
MRIRLLWILTIATVLTASPARAQTYDRGYPVSMQAYGLGGGHIDCSYASLAPNPHVRFCSDGEDGRPSFQ